MEGHTWQHVNPQEPIPQPAATSWALVQGFRANNAKHPMAMLISRLYTPGIPCQQRKAPSRSKRFAPAPVAVVPSKVDPILVAPVKLPIPLALVAEPTARILTGHG